MINHISRKKIIHCSEAVCGKSRCKTDLTYDKVSLKKHVLALHI